MSNPARKTVARMTKKAAKFLAPLFRLDDSTVDVVLVSVPGVTYSAHFSSLDGQIYIDPDYAEKLEPEELAHVVGEEVAHALHYRLDPKAWTRGRPKPGKMQREIRKGHARELFEDMLFGGALLEAIGFYSGFLFQEHLFGRDVAHDYCLASALEWRSWRLEECEFRLRNEIRELAAGIERRFWKGDKDLDLPVWLDDACHGIGYLFACSLYGEPDEIRSRVFETALKAESISEPYAQWRSEGKHQDSILNRLSQADIRVI